MPYLDIDKDGNIGGYITKCDRCGKIEDTMDETLDLCRMWKIEIFANRPNPKLGVFCYECAKAITPMVYMLRDVDELRLYVNNLERAINEKRKQRNQDHRPTTDDACQCCERCPQRRLGHRACNGTTQAGEKHQREPVQRNQDRHVQP